MFQLEDRLWWYSGMRSIAGALLESGPRGFDGSTHLDVGCGTGYSMLWLRRKLKTKLSFGVDLSPIAAELWKVRGIDTATRASADALPFMTGKIDLLTCFDVLYQLEDDRVLEALSEFKRVLKPSGWLLIREPAYDWLRGAHDEAVGTRHRFTRVELISKLSSAGFAVHRATYANALLLWLALPHRWLSLGRNGHSDVRPVPEILNRTFRFALNLESRIVRRMNLPLGLSVMLLAQCPASD